MIGYAFCGSFCTLRESLLVLETLLLSGEEIQPIMSPITYSTDSRFIGCEELKNKVRSLTGKDIIAQLKGKPLGDELLIPAAALRAEGDVLLDDMSPRDIGEALGVEVTPTQSEPYEFINTVLGIK